MIVLPDQLALPDYPIQNYPGNAKNPGKLQNITKKPAKIAKKPFNLEKNFILQSKKLFSDYSLQFPAKNFFRETGKIKLLSREPEKFPENYKILPKNAKNRPKLPKNPLNRLILLPEIPGLTDRITRNNINSPGYPGFNS